jgi:hypothetical protein
MTKRVIIEVSGGVADVSFASKGVDVIVVDHDNLQEEGIDFDPVNDPKALSLWLADIGMGEPPYVNLRLHLGEELKDLAEERVQMSTYLSPYHRELVERHGIEEGLDIHWSWLLTGDESEIVAWAQAREQAIKQEEY